MSDLSVPTRLTHEFAAAPQYAHHDDAGADLQTTEDVRLHPGQRALVGTGVSVAIPQGYVGLVHPRSGLAHRHGLSIVNAPGVIDAGYRGEIMVNLINLDPREVVTLSRGDRIAQLIVQQVQRVSFTLVDELDRTARDGQGHGSTGR